MTNRHYAWLPWSYDWKPGKAGDYTIQVSQPTSQGRTQPRYLYGIQAGYLYKRHDQVKIHFRKSVS